MQFHAEAPPVASLSLMLLGIACLFLILSQGRCRDQHGIDDRSARNLYTTSLQQCADADKYDWTKIF
jgi:hypothetical protein